MKTLHLKNIFKAKIKDNALREESTIYGEQVGEKRCVWVGHLEDRLEEFL